MEKALRKRVAVNFLNGAETFVGYLDEFDDDTYVLEQCEAPPSGRDDVPCKFPGRHYVGRDTCWLQELPT